MTRTVFDASALLAFLRGEDGADRVEDRLVFGGHCSAANWSEVAQKVIASPRGDWTSARALLLDFGLDVEPVTEVDANLAARLRVRGEGLSLADRLCLALADRLSADVVTADSAWAGRQRVTVIR